MKVLAAVTDHTDMKVQMNMGLEVKMLKTGPTDLQFGMGWGAPVMDFLLVHLAILGKNLCYLSGR
jgi:hypothetical protein